MSNENRHWTIPFLLFFLGIFFLPFLVYPFQDFGLLLSFGACKRVWFSYIWILYLMDFLSFTFVLFPFTVLSSNDIHSGRIFLLNGLYLSASKQSLHNVQVMNKKTTQSVFPTALFFFRNSDIHGSMCVCTDFSFLRLTNQRRKVSEWL